MQNVTSGQLTWGNLALAIALLVAGSPSLAAVFPVPETPASWSSQLWAQANCERWWSIFIPQCNVIDPKDEILLSDAIPYVITPRNTHIAQTRPLIHWNAVAGITTYQVKVIQLAGDTEFEPFTTTVTDNEWQYPEDLSLEPGATYRVSVLTDTVFQCSSFTNVCQAEFTVLTNAEMNQLTGDLMALSPEEQQDALALADVYQRNQLYGEAIASLQQNPPTETMAGRYHHFLGALYQQVRLYNRALGEYELAWAMTEFGDDELLKAQLAAAIGEVYAALDNSAGAIAWWEQAKKHLMQVGGEGVEVLEQLIEREQENL